MGAEAYVSQLLPTANVDIGKGKVTVTAERSASIVLPLLVTMIGIMLLTSIGIWSMGQNTSKYALAFLAIFILSIISFTIANQYTILFLTARGSDADRILGLQLGADDYLTKPFLVEELVLRVRGILRRAEWSQTPARTGPVVQIGDNEVDMGTMRATTAAGSVALTEREVMLVRFFSENEGRVLTRGELLERVWGYTFDTSTRTLDTFVHRLRKHFEEDPRHPLHFHTVRGVGYRFTSDPEE
jgi:DNA-binding response OmpR family regulator